MAEAQGEATATLKCLIVDDHPVVRQGIRSLLEKELRGVEITDAPNAQAAIDTNSQPAPDVAVVDPRGAGGEVQEVVGLLRKRLRCAIVVFTSNGGARLLAEALKAGVKGYVRKDSPSEDLVRAIEAARDGEFYVDPALSSTIELYEGH